MSFRLSTIVARPLASLLLLSAATVALATKPAERPQTILAEKERSSVVVDNMRIDEESGRPLAIYTTDYVAAADSPEEMARQYLRANAELLHLLDVELRDLVHHYTRTSRSGATVRFRQHIDGIPVYRSEITISIDARNRITFVMNSYEPFAVAPSMDKSLTEAEARQISLDYLDVQGEIYFGDVSLAIYPADGRPRLVYRVEIVPSASPVGDWEVLLDAQSGEILRVEDIAQYVDGTGYVFDPDPLSTSGASYGDPGFTDDGDASSAELEAERRSRTLPDIDFDGALYTLIGPWAEIVDSEAPHKGLFSQGSSVFEFNRQEDGFEAANCYYHIDHYMRYINVTLGLNITPFQYVGGVRFDPHGFNGEDNSHYLGGTGEITFGEGGVDDAEDADVIIHELGHGLHDWVTGGGLSQVDGLSEGIGDFVAQSYSRSFGHWGIGDPEYYWVFNWDGHNEFWDGRNSNSPDHYPDDLTGGIYHDGAIWSTCMMRIWDAIGSERTDLVHWEGIAMTNSSSNQQDAANAVVQAGLNLGYSSGEMCAIIENFEETGYEITVVSPPVAICQDVLRSADGSCMAVVTPEEVDNGSFDPDGYSITLSLEPPGPYGLGETLVSLTVTDQFCQRDACEATITVVDDTDPVIACPDSVTVECSGENGTPKDDPQLIDFFANVSATDNCDADVEITDDAPDHFPLGVTVVTFTATDDSGNQDECAATVTVEDTTPPEITIELNRYVLWPPNHKMSDIVAVVTVDDVCCTDPTFVLTAIESNEPDNGLGDGDTDGDIQDAVDGTADVEFRLRSERAGGGDGRIYKIFYTASDCVGNMAKDSVEVRVPHDQSGNALAGHGFTDDGADLLPVVRHFSLVIHSVPGFDPSEVDISQACVGNHITALTPLSHVLQDVNHDEIADLELTYDAALTAELRELSAGLDPVGLHYNTADGTDYLVDDIFALGMAVSAVTEPISPSIALFKAVPNPLWKSTQMAYAVPDDGRTYVNITVYNVAGQRVRELVNATQGAGTYRVTWDGRNEAGIRVRSGVYFMRTLIGGEERKVQVTIAR